MLNLFLEYVICPFQPVSGVFYAVKWLVFISVFLNIVDKFEIQCNVVHYLFAADDVVVAVNDAEEEELLTRPGSRWSAASSGSTSCWRRCRKPRSKNRFLSGFSRFQRLKKIVLNVFN